MKKALEQIKKDLAHSQPPDSTLAVLLSRLTLSPDPSLYPSALACLTHPSYSSHPYRSTAKRLSQKHHSGSASTSSPSSSSPFSALPFEDSNNELLAATGNSLLGIFAAEHLANRYPLLPTEALKLAVTAYVGPSACLSVARELGIGVRSGADAGEHGMGQPSASAGVPIRWERMMLDQEEVLIYPDARFNNYLKRQYERNDKDVAAAARKDADAAARASRGKRAEIATKGVDDAAGGSKAEIDEKEAEEDDEERQITWEEEIRQGTTAESQKSTEQMELDPNQSRRIKYAESWDDVVASVVRAFVGLIFEQRVSAAVVWRNIVVEQPI